MKVYVRGCRKWFYNLVNLLQGAVIAHLHKNFSRFSADMILHYRVTTLRKNEEMLWNCTEICQEREMTEITSRQGKLFIANFTFRLCRGRM